MLASYYHKCGGILELIENYETGYKFSQGILSSETIIKILKDEKLKAEIRRAFKFHWAKYTFREGLPVVIDSKGEEVVKYTYKELIIS